MPSSAQVTTHSTNNNLHPGIVDQPRRQHTKAEMAAFQAEEAEKKLQKELEKQVKVDRIAVLEKVLEDELEATPRPNFKQKLRRRQAYLEIPVNEDSKGSGEESEDADQYFEPTSGNKVTTDSGIETETLPKKKKKANKEPVRVAIKAACSSVGNEGMVKEGPAKEKRLAGTFNDSSHKAGKEVPHGGCVSDQLGQGITNDGQIKVKR